MRYLFLILFCILSIVSNAQKKNSFFTSFGFGPAGTFFATTYNEQPFPSRYPRYIYNKKFVGRAFFFAVGKEMNNHFSIQLRYSNQHFAKKINVIDTLPSSGVYFRYYGRIRHVNHLFELFADKEISVQKTSSLKFGLGLYYVSPTQGELEIYPNIIVFDERDKAKYNLEELGALGELAYEYKFQPKVSIGLKSQFYYTISAPGPESITLLPYIKINF